jgi:hypothetical protein
VLRRLVVVQLDNAAAVGGDFYFRKWRCIYARDAQTGG